MVVARARGVEKTYGTGRARRPVLRGASLELRRGELVALVGPSGSGKSTLLHVLGGLDRADAGLVEVAGVRIDGAGERALTAVRREHVGIVFQQFHLVPELSGAQNVRLAASIAGERVPVGALLEQLGIAAVAGSRPHELSGGEQQRFAIARALVSDPSLLLADEPTGSLDEAAGADVLGRLRAVADSGRAVLLVTHDPAAAGIADRVLQMHEGVIA